MKVSTRDGHFAPGECALEPICSQFFANEVGEGSIIELTSRPSTAIVPTTPPPPAVVTLNPLKKQVLTNFTSTRCFHCSCIDSEPQSNYGSCVSIF